MNTSKHSYSLPEETLPSLKMQHHLRDVVEIRTFLDVRGVDTSNTRLERYEQYLRRIVDVGISCADAPSIFKSSADERFRQPIDWYLYVLRELHELMWILKGLQVRVPMGLDAKLDVLRRGSDFAALDGTSKSRDVQFELRIASYFCQRGFEVDLSSKTDIIASIGRYVFYIECKRVGKDRQLPKRLSEARKQLTARMPRRREGKRVGGCIAVDVTKVAFAHKESLNKSFSYRF